MCLHQWHRGVASHRSFGQTRFGQMNGPPLVAAHFRIALRSSTNLRGRFLQWPIWDARFTWPIHTLMTEPRRSFPTRPYHPFALHHAAFYLCHSMPRQRALSAGATKSACRENCNPCA
jgi:hypothetical protein